MPLLKRLFGQGKSKASNTLVTLCIGDYTRVTLPIVGCEAHQLEGLLVREASEEDASPNTSQPAPHSTKSSALNHHQTSFKAFRHLLQHLGGASSATHDGAEEESHQMLAQFLKQLGGYPTVSFITPAEDGLISRDKVLAKLTKLFKHSTAPVVLVAYCGPSDERGNWLLAGQGPCASSGSNGGTTNSPGGGGGVSAAAAVGSSSAGGGSGGTSPCTSVVGFREVSMLWQRYRKHSQRLVLLLDCANSGYWVAALRMLSKAEQLELSLGVQASDSCLPALQGWQRTYHPGVFLQCFLANNKWRRTPQHQQQQPQPGAAAGGGGGGTAYGGGGGHAGMHVGGSSSGATASGRGGDQWLPGMLPSYYATWLNENLVDYGIALRFFNTQAPPEGSQPNSAATTDPGGLLSPSLSSALTNNHTRRSSTTTALEVSESGRSFSRQVEESGPITPGTDLCASHGSIRRSRGPLPQHTTEGAAGVVAPTSARALSLGDVARRRYSSLAVYCASSIHDGSPNTGPASAGPTCTQPIVGSPAGNPLLDRVRMSTPQASWHAPGTSPSASFAPHRSPTLPGEDSLYKVCDNDTDYSASTLPQVADRPSCQAASNYGPLASSTSSKNNNNNNNTMFSTPIDAPLRFASGSGLGEPPGAAASSAPGYHAPVLSAAAATTPTVTVVATAVAATRAAAAAAQNAALHPNDVIIEDESTSEATALVLAGGSSVPGGGGDDSMAVQASARSDTVAVAWAQRSTQAERRLLGDDRGAGTAVASSSFTEAATTARGFAKQLFGALHDVATERRLRARRAPLEGDESLDIMMEDADLERRASVASLPSAMLPRDLRCGGGAGGPGGGGGGIDSGGTSGATTAEIVSPMPRTQLCNSAAPSVKGGGRWLGSVLGSVSGALQRGVVPSGMDGGGAGGEAELPSGEQRHQLFVTTRQPSRLFLVSMGAVESTLSQEGELRPAGHPGGSLEEDGEEEEDEEEEQETGDEMMTFMGSGYEAEGQQRQDSYPGGQPQGSGEQQQQQNGNDLEDAAGRSLLFRSGSSIQESAFEPSAAAKEAAVAGSVLFSPQVSTDWIPAAQSQTGPSLVSGVQDRSRLRASLGGSHLPSVGAGQLANSSGAGNGAPNNILRSVLKAQVSIMDTADMDSASFANTPLWQRRPGRFEMAGSERSSLVFGDDRERFELLKMLRDQQGEGVEALGFQDDTGGGGAGACSGDGDGDGVAAVGGVRGLYSGYGSDMAGGMQDEVHSGLGELVVGGGGTAPVMAYGSGAMVLSMEGVGGLSPGLPQDVQQRQQRGAYCRPGGGVVSEEGSGVEGGAVQSCGAEGDVGRVCDMVAADPGVLIVREEDVGMHLV